MPTKRFKLEQIANLLRKIEVEIANGEKPAQAAREVDCSNAGQAKVNDNSRL